MSAETLNTEVLTGISLSPEEQDMMTMNALLGSVDDSMAKLEQARRNNADAEILEQISGKVTDTYTATRENFSDNLEYLYATFEAMAERVSAMGCDHDHFLEASLDAYNDQSERTRDNRSDHKHGHASSDKTATERKKYSKKKDRKTKRLSGWAIFGLVDRV